MMKLYSYDHCPYCVKARMIFGLRAIPVEVAVLLNDDEKTPIDLIGEKMLPILIKPDGSAMAESLDIVRYIDEYAGGEGIAWEIRPEISDWLSSLVQTNIKLTMPRCTRIGLEEFATAAAVAYFTRKKTQIIGDFSENLAESATHITAVNTMLPDLAALLRASNSLNTRPGMEDIEMFPILRNLTMVEGIKWPTPLRVYLEKMSAQSGVPLFFDCAI